MGWSLKLGKWFGIEVNLHVTFLLLIGFLALTGFAATRNAGAVAGNIGFLLAVFACVLLHELGHALAARRYGIRTRDIILLPIGGLARLERMPRTAAGARGGAGRPGGQPGDRGAAGAADGPLVRRRAALAGFEVLFTTNLVLASTSSRRSRWTAGACCGRCWQ